MSPETIATGIIFSSQLYLGLGALFAVAFALVLAARIDPGAANSSWGFKLLILPSAALLWPLLLWRVLKKRPPPVECNAHRALARQRRATPANHDPEAGQ